MPSRRESQRERWRKHRQLQHDTVKEDLAAFKTAHAKQYALQKNLRARQKLSGMNRRARLHDDSMTNKHNMYYQTKQGVRNYFALSNKQIKKADLQNYDTKGGVMKEFEEAKTNRRRLAKRLGLAKRTKQTHEQEF